MNRLQELCDPFLHLVYIVGCTVFFVFVFNLHTSHIAGNGFVTVALPIAVVLQRPPTLFLFSQPHSLPRHSHCSNKKSKKKRTKGKERKTGKQIHIKHSTKMLRRCGITLCAAAAAASPPLTRARRTFSGAKHR